MSNRIFKSLLLACALVSQSAMSCTVFEFMESSIPQNSTEIPNKDRLKIASMVITARTWPDTQIRGVVQPAAYIHESNPQKLVNERGAKLKRYLEQLGVKDENIWMEPHILTEAEARNERGDLKIHQIGVTLYPICEGGCSRLCDDPRVTPVSKAIIR
jgi:hypothetical protein